MNTINNFRELLVHQLRDGVSNVTQMSFLLPKMSEVASDQDLREILQQAGQRCKEHQKLLRECLQSLRADGQPETCQAMIGMIEEGNHLLDMIEDASVRDAALVVIAQKMQHYGIAAYGSMRAHAHQLDQASIVSKVEKIMQDEKKLDKKLTRIAESCVNERALAHA